MFLRIEQYEDNTNICVNTMMVSCNSLQECYSAINNYSTKFDIDGYYVHYFISTYKGGKKNG